MKFDEDDLRILRELQQNAKQTVTELSKRLELRPSTVYDKISRMEEAGVIHAYRAILNDAAVGVPLTAFILVSGRPNFNIEEAVLRDPRVLEVWGITGEYDILVKGRFRDIDEFSSFVLSLREKHKENINRTETFISTIRIKETTAMPIKLSPSRQESMRR